MDEMLVQCPWESVGVGFLAIALADSKKGTGLTELPTQKSTRHTIYIGPNHCPPTTLFSILMNPTNNV
jgi:hypothetical protein